MYEMFPRLRERQHTEAGVLSGGEQQMLTLCRTLMGDPDLIIIDEPTEGLAPKLIEQVAVLLGEIARRGVAILLVEQKLTIALKIAGRVMVMGHGVGVTAILGESSDISRCAGEAGDEQEVLVLADQRGDRGDAVEHEVGRGGAGDLASLG